MKTEKEELRAAVGSLIRPAKLFRVTPTREHPGVCASKFGGLPYLPKGDKWPQCKGCGKSMSFVCQLHLTETGEDLPNRDSFITFFYCFGCRPTDDDPYDDGCWSVRTYRSPSAENSEVLAMPSDADQPLLAAIQLVATRSLPDHSYLSLMGGTEGLIELCRKLDPEDPGRQYEQTAEDLVGPSEIRSQLGGYQHGPQGSVFVANATFVLQVDSLEAPLVDSGLAWGAGAGVVMLFMANDWPHRFLLRVESC